MAEGTQGALGETAAFQLANVTKTPPQYGAGALQHLRRGGPDGGCVMESQARAKHGATVDSNRIIWIRLNPCTGS
jgi:hypothetical protein